MKSRVYFKKGLQVMVNVFTTTVLFLLMFNPCYAARDPAEVPTTTFTCGYDLDAGYHKVSVPVKTTDMTLSKLFPSVVGAWTINKDATYTALKTTDSVPACQPLLLYVPTGGGSYDILGQPAMDKIELKVTASASGTTLIPIGSFLTQGKVRVKVDGVEATAGVTGVNTFNVIAFGREKAYDKLEPQHVHQVIVNHATTAQAIDVTLTPLNAGRMTVTITSIIVTKSCSKKYTYKVEYKVQNPQAEADTFLVFCDARKDSCKKGESGYSKIQSIAAAIAAANGEATGTITVSTYTKADKIILYITNTEDEYIISKAEKAIQ